MSHENSGSETWKYPQRAKCLNISITKVNYFSKILQRTLLEFMFSWVSTYVTHFRPIVSFDTSWKYQKISLVLIFPGSKKQNILLKYLCPDSHELFQLERGAQKILWQLLEVFHNILRNIFKNLSTKLKTDPLMTNVLHDI